MRTRTCEFDLARPAPIWGLSGYSAAQILIRANGTPRGWVTLALDRGADVLSVETLRAAVSRTSRSATAEPHEASPLPSISVIVCTRDRAESLRGCLDSLARLDYPAHAYEIIVVDNASKEPATAQVVAATPFRYTREEQPGLDRARNHGLAAARFDLIAYTDDDVRVDSQWLRGIARGFADAPTDAVTGLVCPLELETAAQRQFEHYGGMGKGFEPRLFDGATMAERERIRAHALGVGANMAYRRAALEALGGFDPHLDVGTPAGGAGDLDMLHRVLASGRRARYEPTALVWHQHRRSVEGLHKQVYANGQSFGVYLIKIAKQRSAPRDVVIRYALREWLAGWLVGGLLGRRPGRETTLIAAELWGALNAPVAYHRTYRGRSQ